MLQLLFVDIQQSVVSDLKSKFISEDINLSDTQVMFINGKVQDIDNVDCYVSPGNSYGIMTGGIDHVYRSLFGIYLQDNIQHEIFFERQLKSGLPVGAAITVNFEGRTKRINKFIYAPTMEIPMRLAGKEDNIAMAFIAVYSEIIKIKNSEYMGKPMRVVIPGLGTLSGGISSKVHAEQITKAIKYLQGR